MPEPTPDSEAVTAPITSPTGEAIISPVVAKWVAPIALIAGVLVLEGPEVGLILPVVIAPWVKLIYLFGTMFGIISPGIRRKVV